MQQLKNYHMEEVGRWVRSDHKSVKHLANLPGINFELDADIGGERNVVYAFLIDGEVIYVGETTAGLKSRFQGYRYGNPAIKDTDNRIKERITKALLAGKQVSIWAGTPRAIYILADGTELELPLSKPIEEKLINDLDTPENVKNINRIN